VKGPGPAADAAALAALYALVFALRFLFEPGGFFELEEASQATAALLWFREPSFDGLLRLQYASWCGGCSAELLVAGPLLVWADGALWIWKLVPLSFGLATLLLAWSLAHRAAGRGAAAAVGLLLILAPSHFALNRMHAWGNHFESAALVLLSLWLWARWLEGRARGGALALGLVAGLGFWFCYSTAFVLPVLTLLALLLRPRALVRAVPVGALGLLLGLLPWLLSQGRLAALGLLPEGQGWLSLYGARPWALLTGGPELGTRLSDVIGPGFWRVSVGEAFGAWALPVGGLLWIATSAAVLMGLPRARGWLAAAREAPWRRAVPAAAAALVLLYLVINVLLRPPFLYEGPFLDSKALRYHALIYPVQALCLALLAAGCWRRGRAWSRTAALLVAGFCLAVGALDLGAVLLRGSADPGVLRASAVERYQLCGRVGDLELGEAQGPSAFLEQRLRGAPRAPVARRLWLHRTGQGLGWSFVLGRPAAWSQGVAGLHSSDASWLLDGVACAAWRDVGQQRWQPALGPISGTERLVAALDPALAARFTEGLLHHAAIDDPAVADAVRTLDWGGQTASLEAYPGHVRGLARYRGRLQAQKLLLGDAPETARALEDAVADLPLPPGEPWVQLRRAYARGLGCGLGLRRGAHPEQLAALEGQPDARQGFLECGAEAFPGPS
jgi:4-amino-4-deoxy-L-arabinose transferase-like glycosyltransferase